MRYDVIVVGSGPAGAIAAKLGLKWSDKVVVWQKDTESFLIDRCKISKKKIRYMLPEVDLDFFKPASKEQGENPFFETGFSPQGR